MATAKPWSSLSEAVKSIAPAILAMKDDVTRPLRETNAERTVREWLSKLVHSDAAALGKLTPEAQKRLRKP